MPGQSLHTLHAPGDVVRQPSNPRLLAYPLSLELFFNQVLQRSVVSGELRNHGFVVEELRLKFLHPFELRGFQTPVFKVPFIETSGTNAIGCVIPRSLQYRSPPL